MIHIFLFHLKQFSLGAILVLLATFLFDLEQILFVNILVPFGTYLVPFRIDFVCEQVLFHFEQFLLMNKNNKASFRTFEHSTRSKMSIETLSYEIISLIIVSFQQNFLGRFPKWEMATFFHLTPPPKMRKFRNLSYLVCDIKQLETCNKNLNVYTLGAQMFDCLISLHLCLILARILIFR